MSDDTDLSKPDTEPDIGTDAAKKPEAIQSSRVLIDGDAHSERFLRAVKSLATVPKSEFDKTEKSRKSTNKDG